MKRYDLRTLKKNFKKRLNKIANSQDKDNVAIYLLEIADQESLSEAIKILEKQQCDILNSIKYNEVDWTIVARKRA